MVNIAVLGSTRGTNLQTIINELESGNLPNVNICFVLSNKKTAQILERARRHNLKTIFLDPKVHKRRQDYDQKISDLLERHKVDYVLLIGYMKLMTPEFVGHWRNRVTNIHPSLLPAFAGGTDLNVHQAVLDRGCKVSGASLIFIDEGADTGPIISQRVCVVDDNETAGTLKTKVQKLEGEMLVQFLRDVSHSS